MSAKLADLKSLGRLADLVLDRELVQLAAIARQRDDVINQLSDLDSSLQELVAKRSAPNPMKALLLFGYDRDWQDWRSQKKRELNLSLAKIEAEREAARVMAKKAFGRAQALDEIVARLKT